MESSIVQEEAGLPKDSTETQTHYLMRKEVYDRAVQSGKDKERAEVLASIFRNVYFMGCSYPDEVVNESRRFWPKGALENPLYEKLED